MSGKGAYLSPAEAAKRLGVSVKALRVYERHGLITPLRTGADWRAYGPDEMARLHQVLALKRLGLSLAKIAGLLEGHTATLASVLALQEDVLSEEGARVSRALELVRAARAKLASGASLTIDDLTTLTKETTMTSKLSNEEWKEMFDPLIRKNYATEDLAKASGRHFDQEQASLQWNTLFTDAKAVMAKGDPYSTDALEVGRRWRDLVHQFTQGDARLEQGSANVWKDAFANPDVAPRLPVGADLFAFVGRSMQRLKETGQ
jgi:DNA-binding transcriptional MerR regulator